MATCAVCNKNKKASRSRRAALSSYHSGVPLERVHIDILGPFVPSRSNNTCILMIVDQFTKWVECFPLPDQTSEVVSRTLVDQFFSRFGIPVYLHADQGRNFEGNLFQNLCSLLEIAKTRTTPYHPKSNGQVERYNRVVLQAIRCYLQGSQNLWDENLPLITMAMRSTINHSTGFTPN